MRCGAGKTHWNHWAVDHYHFSQGLRTLFPKLRRGNPRDGTTRMGGTILRLKVPDLFISGSIVTVCSLVASTPWKVLPMPGIPPKSSILVGFLNHPAISNQIVIWELSTARVANWGNRQNLCTNNHSVIDLIDTAAVCINACGPCYGRRWAGENIPTQQHKTWLWQTNMGKQQTKYIPSGSLVNVYITMENHHV